MIFVLRILGLWFSFGHLIPHLSPFPPLLPTVSLLVLPLLNFDYLCTSDIGLLAYDPTYPITSLVALLTMFVCSRVEIR